MKNFILHGADAADLRPGTWLLEASAGTGKTYTIIGIVIRLLIERGIPIERIVVMTFTRAATAELRERLRRGLHAALSALDGTACDDDFLTALAAAHGDDPTARRRLRMAIASLDAALIATIHGVCHRLLNDHALHTGVSFNADLDGDLSAWRQSTVHDLLRQWSRELTPAAAALITATLDPQQVIAACATIERQPDVTLTGCPALHAAAVNQLIEHVRQQWPEWRSDIYSFYSDEVGITHKAKKLGPVKLPGLLDQLEAMLIAQADSKNLSKVLAEILRPDAAKNKLTPEHLTSLQSRDWHSGLASLFSLQDGVRRCLIEQYRARLLQRPLLAQQLHFQDLLVALDTSLATARGSALTAAVAERYDAVLVDEFQDTDPLQWRILSRLFAGPGKQLFLIGDPKQAIYAFRGADVHAYLGVSALPQLQRATLETNYRTDSELVAAVNHCFDRGPQTFVEPAIQFRPVRAVRPKRLETSDRDPRPLQLWWQPAHSQVDHTRKALAQAVAQEIQHLLFGTTTIAGQAVRPSDIAVLVRNHKDGTLIAEALAQTPQRIASVRNMRDSVFNSHIARELITVLSAILTPHRDGMVRAAALTRLVGVSVEALAAEYSPVLENIISTLQQLRQDWLDRGFLAAWQQILDNGIGEISPRVLLAGGLDGERALTNILHLGDLIGQAEAERQLGPDALLDWLQCQVADPNDAHDDQLLRIDRDDAAVRILTIHTSKGLEFPIVFAPFLWQGSSPTQDQIYHQDHQAFWHFGDQLPQAVEQAQTQEAMAETMRLAYVAMTRAAHRCYIAFAPQPARGSGAGCSLSALSWLARAANASSATSHQVSTEPASDDGWQTLLEAAFSHPHIAIGEAPHTQPVANLSTASQIPQRDSRSVANWASHWRERHFSSYSGLVRNRPVDEPDHDQVRNQAIAPVDDPLPRGANFGSALHEVFENVDFQGPRDSYFNVCQQALTHYGLDDQHAIRLGMLVDRTLSCTLPNSTIPLREAAHQRQCELEVLLPVAATTPDGLATAFADHGGPWTHYAADIGDLALPKGYFTGIIDLLFTHNGRMHILDWKSNDLKKRGGYDHEAMAAEMHHHHYVLQYHLYCVAVHRLLQQRLPHYDYDQHVGDAHYLFVRGIDGSGAGWYHHRPSAAMINALDACFAEVPHATR